MAEAEAVRVLGIIVATLLASGCCLGGATPDVRVRVHGHVYTETGAPAAGAIVELCANDTSGGDYARQRSCVRATTGADGRYDLERGGFVPGGHDGIVDVLTTDDRVATQHRFPAPIAGATTVSATDLYLPGPTVTTPLDGVVVAPMDDSGFRICAPRPLHDCTGRLGEDAQTRRWLAVDIAATTSCESQAADARARCGDALRDPSTLHCLARAGILLHLAAIDSGEYPGVGDHIFVLDCTEGEARLALPGAE